jgi:hypothetical protein
MTESSGDSRGYKPTHDAAHALLFGLAIGFPVNCIHIILNSHDWRRGVAPELAHDRVACLRRSVQPRVRRF